MFGFIVAGAYCLAVAFIAWLGAKAAIDFIVIPAIEYLGRIHKRYGVPRE